MREWAVETRIGTDFNITLKIENLKEWVKNNGVTFDEMLEKEFSSKSSTFVLIKFHLNRGVTNGFYCAKYWIETRDLKNLEN